MDDKNWKQYVKEASHHVAVGNTKIYLYDNANDRPWSLVTTVEDGSPHRLDIATSVRFVAPHKCGLIFSWSWDVENRGSDGSSLYQINTTGIRDVLRELPSAARLQFIAYLGRVVGAMNKRAGEYQSYADNQYVQVRQIRSLIRGDE